MLLTDSTSTHNLLQLPADDMILGRRDELLIFSRSFRLPLSFLKHGSSLFRYSIWRTLPCGTRLFLKGMALRVSWFIDHRSEVFRPLIVTTPSQAVLVSRDHSDLGPRPRRPEPTFVNWIEFFVYSPFIAGCWCGGKSIYS